MGEGLKIQKTNLGRYNFGTLFEDALGILFDNSTKRSVDPVFIWSVWECQSAEKKLKNVQSGLP